MRALWQNLRAKPVAAHRPAPAAADPTRMLDAILGAAAAEGASDVHFEPKEAGLLVRFRVDGETREHTTVPLAQRDALLARGKIFGGLDITEKRLPQDGRAVLLENGRRYHLRLSTLPTVHGESLVIRLLDQTMPTQSFEELGFDPTQATALRAALAGPAGLIYLTGPTGSGKTTTLHAALHALDYRGKVIHTLEDPVEYEFAGIRQTEIREKIGLSFAASLRSLLRQNPDVMLVGETRDAETAQLAIRAALTGHLVLSTLHTNDALAAIPRLRDLGVESFLLAASLRLLAAQRLVRRLCPACKEPHPDGARLCETHRLAVAEFFRPVGCPACRKTGYRGRLAIHEVLPLEKFLPLIADNAPLAEFAALRDRLGYATLWQRGLATAAAGLTTIEQVAHVL
ncbi:MAG: GspE/PulE family protein [Opitutaceae bacterium]|jgi:type II secretory ATPase GspE/PulE/Tfp pilus assembly ATPase PilB-like protein